MPAKKIVSAARKILFGFCSLIILIFLFIEVEPLWLEFDCPWL